MIKHWRFAVMLTIGVLAGWLLSQSGLERVLGQGTKPRDAAKPRFEFHANGWLKLRPEGDPDFDRAKTFGYEVIRDRETGNVLYSLAENGALAAAPGAPNFALRVLPMKNGGAEFIKFSPGQGEAWLLRDAWNRIAEAAAVPAGDYDVVMAEAANNSYFAFRLERRSGRTWFLQENRWNESKEKKPANSSDSDQ